MGCSGNEVSWTGYTVEYPRITGTAPYFFCILRSLRWYKRMTMIPMTPITAKVVKAMSMSDIFINLRSKSHHKLAYIIAILGEVVYLLLFQHGITQIAMDVPQYLVSETY